ncbi:hypothetical protein AVE30378_02200 [Achromobacter veterisilvae]|uniref:Uncharacterized protein n=1 Tax=Achromobacter veterisilvae TaxID=2069367 RepID=A0A446CFQ9_9BURK|nr:hypothetical protein [Achromobacter veterisilvae]SSW66661.1 hypothetical protein AVE30378_02200 [Achromobacter veterisilvae]
MTEQQTTEEVQADIKIWNSREELWAAEKAVREKVGALALQRTLEMGLPSAIDLVKALNHLGPATARVYDAELTRLDGAFQDELPQFVACAYAAYWYAAWDGACWFELSIISGTILDNDYTRSHTTPKGYLAHNGGGGNVMLNVSLDEQKALFSAMLRTTHAPRLKALLEGDEERLMGNLLSAASCYFFHEANSMTVRGTPLTEIMDAVCEAHDLRVQADSFDAWNNAYDCAREDPDLQSDLRRAQARAGALAKLSADPKQRDKALVRECWQAWQAKPESYPSQAAFARDMLTKCAHLVNTRTVEDWCREWGKTAALS